MQTSEGRRRSEGGREERATLVTTRSTYTWGNLSKGSTHYKDKLKKHVSNSCVTCPKCLPNCTFASQAVGCPIQFIFQGEYFPSLDKLKKHVSNSCVTCPKCLPNCTFASQAVGCPICVTILQVIILQVSTVYFPGRVFSYTTSEGWV